MFKSFVLVPATQNAKTGQFTFLLTSSATETKIAQMVLTKFSRLAVQETILFTPMKSAKLNVKTSRIFSSSRISTAMEGGSLATRRNQLIVQLSDLMRDFSNAVAWLVRLLTPLMSAI